jgi:hypothetical protein
MNRPLNLNLNRRPSGVLKCQNRAFSQRVIGGIVSGRLRQSFIRPEPKHNITIRLTKFSSLQRCPISPFHGPLRTNFHASHPFRCNASSQDPDEYELDTGYDSDDYELLEASAAAPRTAAHKSSSPAASTSSSSSYSSSTGGSQQQEQFIYSYGSTIGASSSPKPNSRSTRQAIKTGFNIFLLFGAAIDRCVSRAQAAAFAASLAMLAFTKKALHISSRKVDTATFKARHSFSKSPVGKKVDTWAQKVNEVQQELPDDTWGKLLWLWDRPPVQRIRLTISMANLSIRLPALMALVATQVGLLASQVSLPMLAPLLLGTGMLLRSVKTNASFLLPRIGLLVVMLWLLWFANSVVHNTVAYLRKQGALDNRIAGGIITVSECSTLVTALIVVLSMLGVNVSALLLPAGIAVAVAAKDLSHNFLAGLFLFVVQPFKLGDRLSVSSAAPGVGGPAGGWFEGVCEKVDLRYVIVRQGRRRLMVPNSAFITREFMVMDEGDVPPPPPPGSNNQQNNVIPQQFMTNDYRHVWQYVEGPPVHQELAGGAVLGNAYPRYPPPPPPSMQQQQPNGGQQQQQQPEVAVAANGTPAPPHGNANGATAAPSPLGPVSYPLPDYSPGSPTVVNGNGSAPSSTSSSSTTSTGAGASSSSGPQPVGTYSFVVNNGTPGSPQTTTTHYYTQQPTPPMNSMNGNGVTGYWQQATAPPPPPPPHMYWQQQQNHQQTPTDFNTGL